MTQTVPRNLHSWHTLWPGIAGLRPIRKALMTSSSWPLSIGQPRSSKSTGTWALIGVEVASVFKIFGVRIDGSGEFADIGEVPQGLDAARGGAGANRHQMPRETTHAQDAFGIGGRRNRAFDQREIVRSAHHPPRRFREIGDVELLGDGEQFVLAIEQAQLAAVAGSEFPHCQARAGAARHVRSPEC